MAEQHDLGGERSCYHVVEEQPILFHPAFQVLTGNADDILWVLSDEGEIVAAAFYHNSIIDISINGIIWERHQNQLQMSRATTLYPIELHNCKHCNN